MNCIRRPRRAKPAALSNYNPANNQLVIAGIDGNPSNLGMQTDYNNFAPRLGASYRAHGYRPWSVPDSASAMSPSSTTPTPITTPSRRAPTTPTRQPTEPLYSQHRSGGSGQFRHRNSRNSNSRLRLERDAHGERRTTAPSVWLTSISP